MDRSSRPGLQKLTHYGGEGEIDIPIVFVVWNKYTIRVLGGLNQKGTP